jgi:ribosomal protein S18 acetylase RimI-like enzyme
MITIRRARWVDLPLLATLEREFHRDERKIVLKENQRLKPYVQRRPDRDRIFARWMRKWIRSKNALVLIAEADARPAGFSTASIEINQGIYGPRRHGFIGFVFVRCQYRGQGISSLMMKEMLTWFEKRKIKHVCLSVMEDNKPARAIWEKWGFHDFLVVTWKLD